MLKEIIWLFLKQPMDQLSEPNQFRPRKLGSHGTKSLPRSSIHEQLGEGIVSSKCFLDYAGTLNYMYSKSLKVFRKRRLSWVT